MGLAQILKNLIKNLCGAAQRGSFEKSAVSSRNISEKPGSTSVWAVQLPAQAAPSAAQTPSLTRENTRPRRTFQMPKPSHIPDAQGSVPPASLPAPSTPARAARHRPAQSHCHRNHCHRNHCHRSHCHQNFMLALGNVLCTTHGPVLTEYSSLKNKSFKNSSEADKNKYKVKIKITSGPEKKSGPI